MGHDFQTATTRHVKVGSVDFTYRRIGQGTGRPVVLPQHFTGTMDAWDPSVVDALAATRPVIVFNNAGVGTSSGSVPDNVERMSTDAEDFILALGLGEVDLLGFSLGGFIAQVIAARDRVKVRKLIIAGSAPKGGEEHLTRVVGDAFAKGARDVRLPLFFTPSSRPDLTSPEAMGGFLLKLLDRLGIERAHIVAPDIGTLAALFAASKAPERFESIVGGSGGISLGLLGDPLCQIVESTRDDFAAAEGGEQVYQLVKGMARVAIPEAVLGDYRASSHGQRWNEVADFVRPYRRDLPRLATLLPGLAVPALVSSGKDDPYVPPSNGDFLAAPMSLRRHPPYLPFMARETGSRHRGTSRDGKRQVESHQPPRL